MSLEGFWGEPIGHVCGGEVDVLRCEYLVLYRIL